MGKYNVPAAKWKDTKPSFTLFRIDFVNDFKSLKCVTNKNKKNI